VRVNYAFSHLIRERKTHQFPSQIQSSRQDGTIAFDESLSRAVRSGRVAVEEAMRVCRDPNLFKILLNAEA
jgi:Tfp pilus assembly pilus retraction ATPase PilT